MVALIPGADAFIKQSKYYFEGPSIFGPMEFINLFFALMES
jgi:hypothetical protein